MDSRTNSEKEIIKRIRIAFLVLFVISAILLTRLFFLQVVSGAYYKTQASRQQNFSQVLTPRRGEIYLRERSGEQFPLASTKEGYLLFINPKKLENPEEVFAKLSRVADLDREEFFMRAAKKTDPYEVVAHNLERTEAEKIEALEIENIGVVPEEWRVYPAKSMASHVVGFLGYKDDELLGQYGLERYFEDILRGTTGWVAGSQSAGGIILELGRRLFSPPEEGYDIVLTLEPNVQVFIEKKLKEIKETWQPSRGGAVVMDPQTGKILAMAAFPNFDPNNYGDEESLNVFVNPLVENIYEFGSVFKPLTVAAGLDKGVITPETTYYDHGFLELDGFTIRNFDGKGRGETTIQKVLEESLNTGAAFVAQKLGKKSMKEYFENYGLAEKTNITLPGEVKGNLANLNSTREVEFATASFGQGVATTPIAFARAAASLANGGKLVEPYLVERVIRPGREDVVYEAKKARQILKPETSETISRMMVKVADDALLGGTAKFKHWTAAAKTGTAQIPSPDGKGYSEEYLHSFLAWAPGFDAKFLLFMYIEKPQGVRYGSQSLGPYYDDIMQFLLTYYDVPPDR